MIRILIGVIATTLFRSLAAVLAILEEEAFVDCGGYGCDPDSRNVAAACLALVKLTSAPSRRRTDEDMSDGETQEKTLRLDSAETLPTSLCRSG